MLILSRKGGEAIDIGGTHFSVRAQIGPTPTVLGGGGPTGGGETGPAPCAIFAVDPGRSAGGWGRAGSDRRRDRPTIGGGD